MMGGQRQDASSMETLKLQDFEDIVNETRYVAAASPSVNSSGQAINGANNTPTTVYGISTDYLEIRRYEIEDGEMFREQDVQTAAKVCVLGKTVVDYLFPDGSSPSPAGPGRSARGQPIDGNAGHCNPRRAHHAARYEKREGGLMVVLPLFQSPPSLADGGVFCLCPEAPTALPRSL